MYTYYNPAQGENPSDTLRSVKKTFTPAPGLSGSVAFRHFPAMLSATLNHQTCKTQCETQSPDTVIAELKVEVMSLPEVPDDAEVLAESTAHVCPPRLAIKAIGSSLTPRKMAGYKRNEAKGESGANDPACATF